MLKTLKNIIDSSIYNYPTLYRRGNYEKSRIAVLMHMYCVSGNGTRWYKEGGFSNPELKKVTLPKDLCLYEFLYVPHVDTENLIQMEQVNNIMFQCDMFFGKNEGKSKYKNFYFYFYNITDFFFNFLDDNNSGLKKLQEDNPNIIISRHQHVEDTPHPMDSYSKLAEMVYGIAPELKNREVKPLFFRKDFIQGGIDIATYILKWYYENPTKEPHSEFLLSKDNNIKICKEYLEKFVDKV